VGRSLLITLGILTLALIPAACGGDEAGPPTPEPAASVDGVRAEAERATGVTLSSADLPDGGKEAGIAAVFTSGASAQEGQRLLVTVGIGETPNAIDESLQAELGTLAGIDVEASSAASGWGTKLIRGSGSPVFVIYWAEAPTKEELESLDRSQNLKDAMVPFGLPADTS
jgi:hypothetical protein